MQRLKDTPFIDSLIYTTRPLLFMDPPGPSLFQLTSPRLGTKQLLPEEEVLNLLSSVVLGLEELAENGFDGHGDVSL